MGTSSGESGGEEHHVVRVDAQTVLTWESRAIVRHGSETSQPLRDELTHLSSAERTTSMPPARIVAPASHDRLPPSSTQSSLESLALRTLAPRQADGRQQGDCKNGRLRAEWTNMRPCDRLLAPKSVDAQ